MAIFFVPATSRRQMLTSPPVDRRRDATASTMRCKFYSLEVLATGVLTYNQATRNFLLHLNRQESSFG